MTGAVLQLDPARYVPHALHSDERAWPESNCYVDLWIELLHALRLDPVAGMAFTLATDFEGDQWTFFKQPLGDLDALYGVDVQELAIWRPLHDHVAEQVGRGRPVLVEVDSYFLPDTAGTVYRAEHVKTTIAVTAMDVAGERLGYFHNAGFFALAGDDFRGLFRLDEPGDVVSLAPYVEFVKLDRLVHRPVSELRAIATEQAAHHCSRRPRENPVAKFRARFLDDVQWLAGGGMVMFHAYAFATLRQLGACTELAAAFLRWLDEDGEREMQGAAGHFADVASTAKTMQFKLARAVGTKKPVDFVPLLDTLASSWESAMSRLAARYAN